MVSRDVFIFRLLEKASGRDGSDMKLTGFGIAQYLEDPSALWKLSAERRWMWATYNGVAMLQKFYYVNRTGPKQISGCLALLCTSCL